MKILVIRGKDLHTYRLVNGFNSIGVNIKVINSFKDYDKSFYNFIFIDHTLDEEEVPKLHCDKLIFFDCEDDHGHFKPGKTYDILKQEINFYAKYSYDESVWSEPQKLIGIPVDVFLNCAQIARQLPIVNTEPVPYFVGAPTYRTVIEGFNTINTTKYRTYKDTYSIGIDPRHGVVYNQRVDWLSDLLESGLKNNCHISFSEGEDHCYGIKFQSSLFGNVCKFSGPRISYRDHFINLINNKISLCPTGHDRMSFRTFDSMAAGSLMLMSGINNSRTLYMPKHSITIKVGESISKVVNEISKSIKDHLDYSIENKNLMMSLTPEKIKEDFISQLQ